MDVWTLKVISIFIITAINFIAGFIPFFFITRNMKLITRQAIHFAIISPTMKRLLSLGNFFSAGVFLSTCLIGLYPGVNSKFNNIVKRNPTIRNYPYAGLSVAGGFFLVWLLEVLVHGCIHRHSHASHARDHDHGHVHYHNDDHNDHDHDHVHYHKDHHDPDQDHDHLHYHTDDHDHDHDNVHYHKDNHHDDNHHDRPVDETHHNDHVDDHSTNDDNHEHDTVDDCDQDHIQDHILIHTCDHDQQSDPPVTNNNSESVVMKNTLILKQNDSEDQLLSNGEDDVHDRDQEDVIIVEGDEPHSHIPISGNVLGSVMLTFALGSHSVIEGLGFGVLDDLGTVINMLVTMVIHESICAISLGVNIASKKTPMKVAVILIVIFSILIPVGIALGLIVNLGIYKTVTGEVITAVLQGVAAGTFIYVVFIEILPNEMSSNADQWLRAFIMILGFAVIAAMKAAHSDGDSSLPSNQTSSPSLVTSTHTH